MDSLHLIGYSVIGGFVPALIWLAFWLTEDRCQPEPKLRLLLTFLAGMVTVAIAIPLENAASSFTTGAPPLLIWASIEEILKLLAAATFGLLSADFDEPIDAVIYMITAALGFAAAENILFLFGTMYQGDILQGLILGDTRFVGATLLHSLSSATVGLFMALAFYRSETMKKIALAAGVILAIFLHTLFNFFILAQGGSLAVSVFLSIWAGIIVLLFLLERVKNAKDYC